MKSLIATSTYFLLRYNLKNKNWKVIFGRLSLGAQTGVTVSKIDWIYPWLVCFSMPWNKVLSRLSFNSVKISSFCWGLSKEVFAEVWGEWPNGLRCYVWNWKVLSSNSTRQGFPNRVDWWGTVWAKWSKTAWKWQNQHFWVKTGISGNLVVKSKLPPWSGSSLEAVEPHP